MKHLLIEYFEQVNCLKPRPRWMEKDLMIIGDIPLTELMIPGTHDSGAIMEFNSYFAGNVLNRFSVNQDESIWNQLAWGIRFFGKREREMTLRLCGKAPLSF